MNLSISTWFGCVIATITSVARQGRNPLPATGRRRARFSPRTARPSGRTGAESLPPNPDNAAGFGNCLPTGGWLRWNPYRLDEAPAGRQTGRAEGTTAMTPEICTIIAAAIAGKAA